MSGTIWDKKMSRRGSCPALAYETVGGTYQSLPKHNKGGIWRQREIWARYYKKKNSN